MTEIQLLSDSSRFSDIAALETECFSEPWSKAALAEAAQYGALFFAALHDGRVIGYAGLKPVVDEGYISNVAVTASERRTGCGRALMRSVDAWAEEHGLVTVSLEVRESNLAAQALYLSCGYETVGKRRGFYSHPTEDAIIMTKYYGAECR